MEYGRAVIARDAEGAAACFTPEARLVVGGAEHVPFVGSFDGQDEIRRFFDLMFATTEADQSFVPRSTEVIEHDEHLIVFSQFRHRVTETGRYYSGDYALHCIIDSGLITRYQIYENSWSVGQAFDPPSPPNQGGWD